MNKIVHSLVKKNIVLVFRHAAVSLDIVAINYTIDIFVVKNKACHCQHFLQSITTEEEEEKKQTRQSIL